jgi:hypothetical protein
MMRRFAAVLISVALPIVSTQSLLARQIQRRSTWDELPRLILGMNIRMTLPDSTVIRGRALDVRPDELVVDIRRTSDPRLHPKGRTGIPRPDVATLELFARRLPGAAPNVGAIGAGIGGAAVSPLLFYLGEKEEISGWAALAIAIGAATAGAMIANRLHGTSSDVLVIVVQ